MKKKKRWFSLFEKLIRVRYKKTDFRYLAGDLEPGSIVLSNHEGTDGPMAWHLYSKKNTRFWAAAEMNSDILSLYKYQSLVYYCEKKHWKKGTAMMFCLIATPITYIFYRGLQPISVYKNLKFRKTVEKSLKCLKDGETIVLFPEVSDEGYSDVLKGFHKGFLSLTDYCSKNDYDAPIYVAYYNKKRGICIVDKPVKYSVVKSYGLSKDELCDKFCQRCNELGEMSRA